MEEALGPAARYDVDPLSQGGHPNCGCEDPQEPFQGSVRHPYGLTLNKVILPAGESVYQNAKGQPIPSQRWPTEFHYVDDGL